MFVAIYHRILMPDSFRALATDALSRPPRGIHMLFSFPSQGGTEAISMWHAQSVEALRAFVEPIIEGMSENRFFPVDAARAQGISALSPGQVPALNLVREPEPV